MKSGELVDSSLGGLSAVVREGLGCADLLDLAKRPSRGSYFDWPF